MDKSLSMVGKFEKTIIKDFFFGKPPFSYIIIDSCNIAGFNGYFIKRATMDMPVGDNRPEPAKNVLGEPMVICCEDPLTGFYRNGKCDTGPDDHGLHTVCVQVTSEFLEYSKSVGNDLSTPMNEFGFPGLKVGDRWCLCLSRWKQAYDTGKAPRVYLASTHEASLELVPLEVFLEYALDLN